MNMETISGWIDTYVDSNELAWAPSTLRSERHRLHGCVHLIDGNPRTLFDGLAAGKPYSRLTAFTRVGAFWDFLRKNGVVSGESEKENPYQEFKRRQRQAFKGSYSPKLPTLNYDEVLRLIATIPHEATQAKASQLLNGGLRFTESLCIRNGEVTGKGGKVRRVFVPETDFKLSYGTFARHLRSVGLSAHMLRKVAATRMAQRGATASDLCSVFGWSSFQTAQAYVAPREDSKLKDMLQGTA